MVASPTAVNARGYNFSLWRFPAKNQEVPLLERDFVVGTPRLRRQEKKSRVFVLGGVQRGKGIPEAHVDFLPIIETGAFQLAIVDGKPERFDQMQSRSGGKTEAPDVAVFGGISGSTRTTLNNYLPNLLATNFSSFTISAANLRMPSAVFSVAIAFSLRR